MKNNLRLLAITLFLFFTTQPHASQIDKINYIGLINSSESELNELLPFKTGQEYTKSKSDEIISTLFETGLFSDIEIVKANNSLNISVKENPYIKYFEPSFDSELSWKAFLNPVEAIFSENEIRDFASSLLITPGEVYSERKISEFLSLLESKYFDQGFYNVTILIDSKVDIQNRIGLDIKINQGERSRIESLKIRGATIFDEKELLSLFKIGEPDFALVNYFTNKDDFSDTELRKGLEKITNKYFNSGYLDFNIIDVSTSLNDEKNKISIIIDITEGIKYKLGSISFSGELGNQSTESLLSSLKIKSGDVFNRSLIMADIETITDIYADQGYAFIDIQPITSDFLDTVNVSIDISLNKKIYVNRITISGNTRTQDTVIRRELKIAEGGLYSRSTLRESVDKLRRLGYFSEVDMVATEVKDMPDKIDLNFIVEETKTGSISLSLSHSNSYGISLGAGIQEKNIFGSGNTLNTEVRFSESFNKISFYFENPNFNDKGHSTNFGVYISEIKDDDVMSDSYEISTKGASFGYGVPLTDNTRINANVDYSTNEIKCGSAFNSSDYELSQCQSNDNDELSLKINWNESTLNDYLYPTQGRSNSVSLNIGTPIGDYKYYSLNTNHTSYSEVNENLTLKLAGSLDIANGYGGKELPFFKRFFGGGSGSVRGFGNKTLGPLYPNGQAKGGELSVFGSANLITPAFFFDNNEKMRLSAFIDTGNVFEKSSSLKINELRMSTGIGFAYLSPIGAIGIYTSTPLIKKSGDIIENFGFTLGTGF